MHKPPITNSLGAVCRSDMRSNIVPFHDNMNCTVTFIFPKQSSTEEMPLFTDFILCQW